MYSDKIKAILTPPEKKLFSKLGSPRSIQDYLDSLPVNLESQGDTYMSPRLSIQAGTAHCFEGALIAATALAYHGHVPYLMDFQTGYDDEDHVVTLFKVGNAWGAFSKTNHSVLRYRDGIYQSPRELALSYFHEYFMWDGRKSLRAYSAPFDLRRFSPERWVTAPDRLEWLVDELDGSRHFPVASKKQIQNLRRVSKIELANMRNIEWNKSGKRLL